MAENRRAPMTQKGAERLRAELEKLKSTDRPNIIAAIAEARAHGDLKENAEYHAAREMQGFIEGRIQQIEGALSYAESPGAMVSVLASHLVVFIGRTLWLCIRDNPTVAPSRATRRCARSPCSRGRGTVGTGRFRQRRS